MRVLLDTNIILDRFLRREPWYTEAGRLWQAVAEARITAYITATAVIDVWYITRRLAGLAVARSIVRDYLTAFEIVLVDRQALEEGFASPGSDYEDNVQIACAEAARLDGIVTRDPRGFRAATIPILSPAEAVEQIG